MFPMTSTQIADASQAAFPFVVAQGRNIESGIYMARYPTYDYAMHVPVVTEGNPWAFGTMFYTGDTAGQAKFLSAAANDIPFNTFVRDQKTQDFALLGSGWEWNLGEVMQAQMLGVPLNDLKAKGASTSIERLLNSVAMIGTTEKGWTGLLNNALIPRVDAAATGTGSSTFWVNKTPAQIMKDINDGLSSVRTISNEVEWADTIRLPPDAFRDISTRWLGQGDGLMTVLDFLRKNNIYTAETGQPLDIQPLREAATASQDGGGRMVVYRKSSEVLRFHLPMPRNVLPVNQKGIMLFEQGMIARTGGTEWRLPYAAAYIDEITAPPA